MWRKKRHINKIMNIWHDTNLDYVPYFLTLFHITVIKSKMCVWEWHCRSFFMNHKKKKIKKMSQKEKSEKTMMQNQCWERGLNKMNVILQLNSVCLVRMGGTKIVGMPTRYVVFNYKFPDGSWIRPNFFSCIDHWPLVTIFALVISCVKNHWECS